MNKLNLIGENKKSVIFHGSEQIMGSLILSFNVDLIFYEQVLVRRLMKSGSFNNLLLADQYQVSLAENGQGSYLQPDKYDYLIKKISVGNLFHSKAIWINKKNEVQLFIGSGNLGYGGMSNNLEIFASFSSQNTEDLDILKQFTNYVNNLINQSDPDQHLLNRINDLFNSEWLNDKQIQVNEQKLLLHNLENTIFEQIQIIIDKPKKIHVISPFYDKKLLFLNELASFYQLPINVYFQESFTTFPKEYNSDIITPYSYEHPLLKNGNLHAKILIFERDSNFDMFVGSPNATESAMLKLAGSSNSELGILFLNLPKEILENYLPKNKKLAKIDKIQFNSFKNQERFDISLISAHLDRNNYLKIKTSKKLDKSSIISINSAEKIFKIDDKRVAFDEENTISIGWPHQTKEPNLVFLTFNQGISNKILVFNQNKGKSTEDKQMTKDINSLKDVLPTEAFSNLIDILSVSPAYEIIKQKHIKYQQLSKSISNELEETEALIEKEEENFYFKIEEINLPSGKSAFFKAKDNNFKDILNFFKINNKNIKKVDYYQPSLTKNSNEIENEPINKKNNEKTAYEEDKKANKDFIENIKLIVSLCAKNFLDQKDEATYLEYASGMVLNVAFFIYKIQAFKLKLKNGKEQVVQLYKEDFEELSLPIINLIFIWWKAAFKRKEIFKTKKLQIFISYMWTLSLYVTCLIHSAYHKENKHKKDINYQKYGSVLLKTIFLLLNATKQLDLDPDLLLQQIDDLKSRRFIIFSWEKYGNTESVENIMLEFFNYAKEVGLTTDDLKKLLKNTDDLIKLDWKELMQKVLLK